MATLPADSAFRDMGFTDRVEAFDPDKGYIRGATGPRFFHYLKNCFNTFFTSLFVDKLPSGKDKAHRGTSSRWGFLVSRKPRLSCTRPLAEIAALGVISRFGDHPTADHLKGDHPQKNSGVGWRLSQIHSAYISGASRQ